MTQESGHDHAAQEATRAALHLRDAQTESQQALDGIDNAIAGVRELLRRGEDDDQ